MGCGDIFETILDPIGKPISDALGVNSPGDYAFSLPWDYPDMWKSDWRAFKHLLMPDMRKDRETMVNAADTPRRIIYGRVRVSGQIVYACTSGTKAEKLHLIVAFAGHPIDGYENLYLDDKLITDSSIAPYVYHEAYDGTQTTACQKMIDVAGGLWTSDHVGYGIPYIYFEFTYNEGAFPNGLPVPKPVMRGKKVYDPRTGQTSWSENPALCALDYMIMPESGGGMGCEMSEAFNAAANSHAAYSGGDINDEVRIETIIEAADYCDTQVVTPASLRTAYSPDQYYSAGQVVIGSDGLIYQAKISVPADIYNTGDYNPIKANSDLTDPVTDTYWLHTADANTEKRYTCNGTVDINSTPAQLLTPIMDCMSANPVYMQGQWHVLINKPRPAEPEIIDETWLNGGISFKVGSNKNELLNTAKGTFINPLDHYAVTDFPIIQIPDYLTEDREELASNRTLPFTNSPYMAQRLGRLDIEKSRRGRVITLPCNLKALKVAVNDVRKISIAILGWDEQLCRVLDWQLSPTGGINLTLGEEDPAIHYIKVGDLSALPQPALTNLPTPWTVPPPTGLTATEELYATNIASVIKCRVTLAWSQPSVGISRYDVQYSTDGGATWVYLPPVSDTTATINDAQPGTVQYRVRATNSLGAESAWTTIGHTILGKTAPPSTVSGLQAELTRGQMRIFWTASRDLDIAGYELQLALPSTEFPTADDTIYTVDSTIILCDSDDMGWNGSANIKLVTGYAGTSFSWTPTLDGVITILAKSIDTSGNYSVIPARLDYTVNRPGAVLNLSQKVIDNIVELKWAPGAMGSFPIDYYELWKGSVFESADLLGRKYGTFDLISESLAGTFKYWVVAVDVAGLKSAETGVYASVNQPPDYVLIDAQNLDLSTCALTNALLENEQVIMPVNTSITFENHFVGNPDTALEPWASPQDQVTAGYVLYGQPGPSSSLIEKIIDYGAAIPQSKLTMSVTRTDMAGTITWTPELLWSLDGSSYTSLGNVYEVAASNFRYVKYRLAATTSNGGMAAVQQINVKLDVKQKTFVTSNINITDTAGDGTEVTFASLGITPVDIVGITAEAPYTGNATNDPIKTLVNFTDVANPTSFKALAWNKSGIRVAVNGVTVMIRYI